jgi:6-pyruvoyltetrahydropterin/6-carboxytetrahydropterin synthase
MHKVQRYHDFSYGHRVVGHESKCRHLHGHNGRVHFTCTADKLDDVGRVIDFSVVKEKLCMWVEDNWDHRFLAWERDLFVLAVESCLDEHSSDENFETFDDSVVWVPFNPTAENMAQYLAEVIGPQQLAGTGVKLIEVRIEETTKCHASYGV